MFRFVNQYNNALHEVEKQGGKLIVNGVLEGDGYESGCYVKPAIAEIKNEASIVQTETFAPICHKLNIVVRLECYKNYE